ncbi:hypothetical protein JW964_07145 [candidate division KSB1 bacterium]|nr:hypothetical protein [candidate division KSB1 bacterium]
MFENTSDIHHKFFIGIDIGSVSTKIVVLASEQNSALIKKIIENGHQYSLYNSYPANALVNGYQILYSNYTRIFGEPIEKTFSLLQPILKNLISEYIGGVLVTGSGSARLAQLLNIHEVNDFRAISTGVGHLYPDVKTIFELGGDSSRFLTIDTNSKTGEITILDYSKNGDCAAGTGSFFDQQATRLLFKIDEIGDLILATEGTASIAGRCSVFAKSDMIHAQQKGYSPAQILKGLTEAVIRNFRGSVVKGRHLGEKVAFIGGMAANHGAIKAFQKVFELSDEQIIVPELYAWQGALGAAILARQNHQPDFKPTLFPLPPVPNQVKQDLPRTHPLKMDKVTLLRERTVSYSFKNKNLPVTVYLGLDIGSVSTKLAIIDENQTLIKEIYTKTDSRPIDVVTKILKEVNSEFGTQIRVCGVGTTGSGRELIGQLVGADTINDEITAHKTGAMYISHYFLNKSVETIFDIGGQDSKYILIKNGIVVDFAMNEACAAGTGSFLEEQADKLDIKIKDEFAELAFQSQNPIDLGERCTVFMEKVLVPYLQQGAKKEDLLAGLAYSIVQNYLNRVVRGRHIGDVIFFQGGTAYNDAVAAAFSTVLKREIIIPPYNGVLGALGAAILACEKMKRHPQPTRFRGFTLENVSYKLRHFTCKGCVNHCEIQEFSVDDDRSYWGDKCADRYRKARKTDKAPVIPNLIEYREKLFAPFGENSGIGLKLGIPRSMYFHDRFPFWGTYLKKLGFQLILSDQTNKTIIDQGIAASIAEPCFPIIVAHGHIQNLMEKQVDFIFQPNVINAEAQLPQVESFLCPWGQTQPFVFKQTPAFKEYWDRFISPTIRFRQTKSEIQQILYKTFKPFGIKRKRSDSAVEEAFAAQNAFNDELTQTGQKAIQMLLENNESAIILVGRPYNLYDRTVNLNIPDKLRDYYGVNIIPIDFLPLNGIDISDVNDGMFWNFGFKILQTGKWVERHQNFHIIYFTNFKCGPDSYIKHFLPEATTRPFLILQFDGHNNDAGMLTRCEAYLDSKGLLR